MVLNLKNPPWPYPHQPSQKDKFSWVSWGHAHFVSLKGNKFTTTTKRCFHQALTKIQPWSPTPHTPK